MRRTRSSGTWVAAALLFAACAVHDVSRTTGFAPTANAVAITHATVAPVRGTEPLRDTTIVIRDGRIVSVVAGGVAPPDVRHVINANGRWVLPGFIDAHVHLRDLGSARNAILAGVTTARSLGGDHFADVRLRALHERGAEDVPEVIAAGYHIRRRVADAFFLDAPELYDLRGGVSGEADVARIVGALGTRKVDVIKVMMTERAGIPEADFRRRVLTDGEITAVVTAAREIGLPVAAHAHTDEGAASAIRAGVRSVEHGTLLSEDSLAAMKERGTCLVPTLSFWIDMASPGGEYDHPALAERAREMLPRARSVAARAAAMGVTVAAGSDMRYADHGSHTVADEAIEFVRSGISPQAAIEAVTSAAARCLGIESRTGAIAVGLEGDLVIVDGNPLEDIASLENVVAVVNDGRVAVNRLQ